MSKLSPCVSSAVVLALAACAPSLNRTALPDDALAPAAIPTQEVGQVKLWCVGSTNANSCEQRETITTADDDGCTTIHDRVDQITFCPKVGPFFLATSWDGPNGKGKRDWRSLENSLWPLRSDTRYLFSGSGSNDSGGSWKSDGSLTVQGVEQITVPAGTFNTYNIEIVLDHGAYYKINYAPEINSVVFFQRHHISDDDGEPNYLMKIISPWS